MIEKAMQCKTAEDLIEYAKTEGVELSKAEAEAYMTELTDVELDEEALKKIAGGDCYSMDLFACGFGTRDSVPQTASPRRRISSHGIT